MVEYTTTAISGRRPQVMPTNYNIRQHRRRHHCYIFSKHTCVMTSHSQKYGVGEGGIALFLFLCIDLDLSTFLCSRKKKMDHFSDSFFSLCCRHRCQKLKQTHVKSEMFFVDSFFLFAKNFISRLKTALYSSLTSNQIYDPSFKR